MREFVLHNANIKNVRAFTYNLVGIAACLRKSEAQALTLQDIEIVPEAEAKETNEDGLPRAIFVHIKRSKTDQVGQGTILLNLLPAYIHHYYFITLREQGANETKPCKPQTLPCFLPTCLDHNYKVCVCVVKSIKF